jgi:beta-lactamase class A
MTRFLLLIAAFAACAPATPLPIRPSAAEPLPALEAELRQIIRTHTADTAEVAVALIDLASGDSLLIDAHTVMHAASTMKVPVMLELFRRADAGEFSMDDSVLVRNEFRSIADSSTYTLSADDDSDREIYELVGRRMPMRDLVERMITRSSNLATNILIETADPARIAATLDRFGAGEMRVLRGVEDGPAYRRGMNNTTTAYGLMKTLQAIAAGHAASPHATEDMLGVLSRQEFREKIPAGVPGGVRVANKTGWITGIDHDGAIAFPQGRAPYVLVVLTRGLQDRNAATAVAKAISARVYDFVVNGG